MQSIRYATRPRRRATSLATSIVLAVGLGACGHSIEVRTIAAPNADFTGRRTFRILATPAPSNVSLGATDPMLTNSITYQAIRSALRSAFESRGYRYSPQGADLDVAYYATAQPVLDLRTWDYGYDWRGIPRCRVRSVGRHSSGSPRCAHGCAPCGARRRPRLTKRPR